MRWVAVFESSPLMLDVRQQHEADHFAYLRVNQGDILLAGGLRDGPHSPFAGGLWILAPMSRERAVELVEDDPYVVHGKRRYQLFQWGKALPEISVTL